MKYTIRNIFTLEVILLIILSGCRSVNTVTNNGHTAMEIGINQGGELDGTEAQSYTAQSIQLPNKSTRAKLVRVKNSILYTYDNSIQNEGKSVVYATDLNGKILHSYTVEEDMGYISDIYPDRTGLWIMTVIYNEDASGLEMYSGTELLHYKDNANLLESEMNNSFSIDTLASAPIWLVAGSSEKCLYVVESNNITTVDYDGTELFNLRSAGIYYHPCLTSSGQLAICEYFNEQVYIKILDHENAVLSEGYSPNITYRKMFAGSNGYDIYISDGKQLYGVNLGSGESSPILQWLEVGLDANIFEVYAMRNGTYLVAADSGVFLLSPEESDSDQEILTMATFEYDEVAPAVLQFNKEQNEYRIVIKDYSEYNIGDDNTEGINQLNLDIASGNIPDLYDLRDIPISQYIKLGLLEDLNPYIDSDQGIDRADYRESLLAAMEVNDGLYSLIPHVSIISVAVNPKFLEEDSVLSYAKLLELAEEGTVFGDSFSTSYDFIQKAIAGNNSPFVNWADGTCSFDSDEFVCLLEFVNLLQGENQLKSVNEESGNTTVLFEIVGSEGTIIYDSAELDCLNNLEECVVYVGLPGANGVSYLLYPTSLSWGISAQSENKDGAWAFLRRFLMEEYQTSNSLPLLSSAWNIMESDYNTWINEGGNFWSIINGQEVELPITSKIYFEKLENLANLANGFYEKNLALMEIIMDEAQAYFAGDKTSEQAAANIQSRVSLYMAEQG